MGWLCRCAHEATVFSLQMHDKITDGEFQIDYKLQSRALTLFALNKQLLFNKCVLLHTALRGKAAIPKKKVTIPTERLRLVHGSKQLRRTKLCMCKLQCLLFMFLT